jgi:hypothetical protein
LSRCDGLRLRLSLTLIDLVELRLFGLVIRM